LLSLECDTHKSEETVTRTTGILQVPVVIRVLSIIVFLNVLLRDAVKC